MPCQHEDHKNCDRDSLYLEALAVGLTLLPVWWAVRRGTAAVRWSGPWKDSADLVLAGILFHLGAEHVGLNDWYLTHGHAARKSFRTFQQQGDDVVLHGDLDWLRTMGSMDFC